jgi:23S rRNA pseudouridine1911/1915/1917 synthase
MSQSKSHPEIPIIYEDNHLLVVIKPFNLPSQPDDSRDLDLLTLLKIDLKHRYQKAGDVFLGLVHRLDRPTGGVMVFAKTSKAASRLSESIRTRKFVKTYLAVVNGIPAIEKATLNHWLSKNQDRNHVSVVTAETPGAKEASLTYERIATVSTSSHHQMSNFSLLKIELHTGRTHQIRVQFAAIGHPLWGDQRYGKQYIPSGQQLGLWAQELSLIHPTLQTRMDFRANPPKELPWSNWPSFN